MAPTPRELGFSMPAEWEPHEATWLAWPKDPVTWPDRVPKAEAAFVEMMRALTPHERVDLLVDDAASEAKVRKRLRDEGVDNVAFHRVRTADSWIRDYGPNFVKGGQKNKHEVAYNRWRFNAWGGKYDTLLPDDGIPERLPTIQRLRRFTPGLVMEGGSIEVNGAGTVLTTEQCLLNKNRNPTLRRPAIEAALRDHLGVEQVLWLHEGIVGDDTDGHIDDIARFTDANTIVAAVEPDEAEPNHAILEKNLAALKAMRDARGKPFRIVPLPMPGRVATDDGEPLPASYANFYIGNKVALVPAFGHPNDRRAAAVLGERLPGRKVVPIRCEDLVWGMGTIHCVSQQQPAAV
ncbi:MAG: agmatine deiminase family protein [Euryarchaeota archaeon]|nr:agmatine deiminase family protein [Euryarchaeota archaeon]